MTTICGKDDVAIVPFPFTDLARAKTRPALALSKQAANQASGQTIFAMITTASHSQWPTDVPISNLAACGLSKPSVVRFKLFTLDNRLVSRRIGSLHPADARAVQKTLRELVDL
jgi:mRNA interferase MazF